MGTNILVYPVILSKNGDGYFVTVPDFDYDKHLQHWRRVTNFQ